MPVRTKPIVRMPRTTLLLRRKATVHGMEEPLRFLRGVDVVYGSPSQDRFSLLTSREELVTWESTTVTALEVVFGTTTLSAITGRPVSRTSIS